MCKLVLELLGAILEGDIALFGDLFLFQKHFFFELGQVFVTLFFVDPGDQVGGEIDDLFELLSLELFFGFGTHEQVGKP